MDLRFDRNYEVNAWIIRARWFYALGIGVMGILTKMLQSYDLPYSATVLMVGFALIVNLLFVLWLKNAQRTKSKLSFNLLGVSQIAFELFIFSIVFYIAGGLSSVTAIFFVLPIFLTAVLFGTAGSVLASLIAGLFVGAVVYLELTSDILPHLSRYGEMTYEYTRPEVAFVKYISYYIFYVIVGVYLGFLAKLLFRRESQLQEKAHLLEKETKLRKSEIKKTKEIKDKSIAIIANLSDPIIVLDEKHRFSLFNPAAEEIFGIGIPDLGKKVECTGNICHYQYDLESYKALIKRDFKVKRIEEERLHDLEVEEMKIKYKGEDKVYKVITSRVTGDHGEYYGVMKIFYDMTRENRIDRMKSEFISVAAHQLRTPLSAIKWSIDIVMKEVGKKIGKENLDLLTKSYKSNERMIELVNDLLNVSRIEEGRFGFIFKRHNFGEILDAVLTEVKAVAQNRKIKIEIKAPDSLPDVEVDKDKILMVLQNLLDNAVKYSVDSGKVVLEVKRIKNKLQVSVKDSGVGIPKKEQEKLFKKFFRAENVVKMETEGTGLGLFIAKNIIEKHGGEISFKSQEGKGSEFIFTIPIKNGNIKNNK